MIGLPDLLAVGLAGFLAGMAYSHRGCLESLREAAKARALVVDGTAYVLVSLLPAMPGATNNFEFRRPQQPAGELVVLPGGKPEDAA